MRLEAAAVCAELKVNLFPLLCENLSSAEQTKHLHIKDIPADLILWSASNCPSAKTFRTTTSQPPEALANKHTPFIRKRIQPVFWDPFLFWMLTASCKSFHSPQTEKYYYTEIYSVSQHEGICCHSWKTGQLTTVSTWLNTSLSSRGETWTQLQLAVHLLFLTFDSTEGPALLGEKTLPPSGSSSETCFFFSGVCAVVPCRAARISSLWEATLFGSKKDELWYSNEGVCHDVKQVRTAEDQRRAARLCADLYCTPLLGQNSLSSSRFYSREYIRREHLYDQTVWDTC